MSEMTEERMAFLKSAAVPDYTRGRALVYVDEANMPASWELGDEIRLALSKEASNG